MKKIGIFIIGFLFTVLTCTVAQEPFDANAAHKTLDKISIELSVQNVNVNNLEKSIDTLTALLNKAKVCVAQTTSEINTINEELAPQEANARTATSTETQRYLIKKKSTLTQQRSRCQLFVHRADEAILAFKTATQKLTTTKLIKKEPHFFANLITGFKNLPSFYQTFDTTQFFAQSGLSFFSTLAVIFLFIFATIAILGGLWISRTIKPLLKSKKEPSFGDRLVQALIGVFVKYSIPFLLFAFLSIYVAILYRDATTVPLIGLLIYGITALLLFVMLTRILFSPPKPTPGLLSLPKEISLSFKRRIITFGVLLFIGYLFTVLFHYKIIPEDLYRALRTIYITVLTFNLIAIIWLLNDIPRFKFYRPWRILFSIVLSAAFIAIVVADWIGYQGLSVFLLIGIALSFIYLTATWFAYKLLTYFIDLLADNEYEWQKSFRNYLGLSRRRSLPELLCIRWVIFVLALSILILLLLDTWGLPRHELHGLIRYLTEGFTIGKSIVVPSKIMIALTIFTVFVLFTRWLRAFIFRHPSMKMDEGATLAFGSIVGYIGFAASLLFALLIAGVSFTGLAVIAGALSVGIGFGLRDIVANFISGIILLTERPIKPGDRITVGDTEGFVKKIRIRSTQISTLKHSDVIIPNYELISKQVTNFMFRDTFWRIEVAVGVAYGSDVDTVRKILLEVAHAHPEVDKEHPGPAVLFRGFGESSLNFELWCIIRDVNLKFQVHSDLNFAIDREFRQNHITIAFPQQDIYIKSWPEKPSGKT